METMQPKYAGQSRPTLLERRDLDDHTWVLRGTLDKACADRLLSEVMDAATWQQECINVFGPKLQPRLTAWFGMGFSAASKYQTPMPAADWTEELGLLRDELERGTGTSFNSVLANRYRTGSDRVGWHADDEPNLGVDPVIASVSLGATRKFTLRRRSTPQQQIDFQLQHGEVLVMAGRCQSEWEHTLRKAAKWAGERVNLTFRCYQPQ